MVSQSSLPRRRGRPPKNPVEHFDTRAALVHCGVELLTEQGFMNTGIDQVLRRLNIPKGSFYHYFPSKEAFGFEVLESYGRYFARKLDRWLCDESRPPLTRIADFIADAKAGMARYEFRRGCLVGNMGQELGGAHDGFREKLEATFNDWQERLVACLEQAKQVGALAASADCPKIARFFWIGWEGAVLRAKLVRSTEPLDLFAELFFAGLPR